MSIVVDSVEGPPKTYRQNIVYRSMRRTASRTAYNIKKKATDFEKQLRPKGTLHQLNDSVVTPKVQKTPTVRRLNRQISQKLADAAEAGRSFLKRSTANQSSTQPANQVNSSCYRNPAIINTPDIGKSRAKKLLPLMPRTPDSMHMNLLEDGSPSPLSKVVMRAMRERKCKVLAKDRIKIMSTPNQRSARTRFASPRQLHVEVNILAQGLQDLHHTANKITNRSIKG